VKRIIINTPDSVSAILVGGRWEAVSKLLPEQGVVIITDNNLFKQYGERFPDFPILKIKPGEESKQMAVIEKLAGELMKVGIDRSGFILAVGGGVVCDIAGFLSSVYMRGIKCGYVSTSLLSQVDASTGGKTGVNLRQIKNVIGTFRQPDFVICDTTMLRSLPEDEYRSGLSELIKTGLIGDRTIIETLEENYPAIIRRDRELLADLVYRSVKFKASVVAADEKERGLRRILNFGHTFGHAVELHQGIKHGFAVAAGMELATLFSLSRGFIKKNDCERVIGLLRKYNLTGELKMPVRTIREFILHDKKKAGNDIHFVFLKGIGKAAVSKLSIKEIIDFYQQLNKQKSSL